jgi:riboflavin kinase/FMN adenylyltransferase
MPSFLRISGSNNLPASLHGSVVAIGNFDGVHRGHQAVLERALEEAKQRGVPAFVLTFDPHPRTVFRPEIPLFVLTPPEMKARLIEELGFAAIVEHPFTREFASLTAEEFVTQVLQSDMGICHVVTGFDFHFGKNRQGGPAFLMEAGERHGFGVTLVDAFRDEGTEIVSSSRIRSLLTEGQVAECAGLLGYRFTVEAEIIGGQKLGRTLGYPTANMSLPDTMALKEGIYAVRFRDGAGVSRSGVASFGRRPTVNSNGQPLLETFVFDFSGDLYGQNCQVSFFTYLRGEVKFDGLDPLIVQMKRDEEEARMLLSGIAPLSPLDSAITF